MKILFIHGNFPAQFIHLARFLSQDEKNEVVFLSQTERKDIHLPKVRKIKVPKKKIDPKKMKSEKVVEEYFYNGELYGKAMMELAKEGFIPDIVYDHPGWGCSTYVPDIFPNAARICYAEWFYTKDADYTFFSKNKTRPPASFAANRLRNLWQLDALRECDAAISPTFWQYQQYPVEYWYKMRVIHDGIDTNYFVPKSSREEHNSETPHGTQVQGLDLSQFSEIVTYTARGMEPYRGFPQFYRSIPEILAARPDCHIVIMANDDVHYGPSTPEGKTWGQKLQEEVQVDADRVHFLKFSSYPDYLKILQASTVHVYMTAPFVLSWSLLEAMSCGCLVVASDTPPVREVIQQGNTGFLTPFWNSKELGKKVASLLENTFQYDAIRQKAREAIVERYDVRKTFAQQFLLIQEEIIKKKMLTDTLKKIHEANETT